jgi:capsular exopolysaccharide synthesis family protein
VVRLWPKKRAQKNNNTRDLAGYLVTVLDPTGTTSEAYRALRTNLIYAAVDTPPKVILLTGPGHKEGKSTTCANLGVVLAQAGKKTLIIDCDLRKPDVHRIFGVRNISGWVNVLHGEHNLSEVWVEALPELKVVPVGPIPPNPAELLGSGRFAELLNEARQLFDYVLIDSPPTESVSDPMIIAAQADAVLLVLDSQVTRKVSLRRAVRGLEAVGANILGTVMNNVEETRAGSYPYG